jgi:hypothetical protein
MNFLM